MIPFCITLAKKISTLLLTLLLTGCFSNEKTSEKEVESNKTSVQKEESKKVEEKKIKDEKAEDEKASLFTLTTIKGDKLNIHELSGGLNIPEFKDKVVLFIFFGYRCPPCLVEIPALVALIKEGHKDLEIVGLEVQGLDDSSLEVFAKNKAINYHIISGENNQEFISYIASKAGWSGAIPFLLAMNKKGVVELVHTGGLGKTQLTNIYNELKNKK